MARNQSESWFQLTLFSSTTLRSPDSRASFGWQATFRIQQSACQHPSGATPSAKGVPRSGASEAQAAKGDCCLEEFATIDAAKGRNYCDAQARDGAFSAVKVAWPWTRVC